MSDVKDLVTLQAEMGEALCSVRFVLFSGMSYFVTNPRLGPSGPSGNELEMTHSEAICKCYIRFLIYCFVLTSSLLGCHLDMVLEELWEFLSHNAVMRIFIAPPTERYAVRTYKEDLVVAQDGVVLAVLVFFVLHLRLLPGWVDLLFIFCRSVQIQDLHFRDNAKFLCYSCTIPRRSFLADEKLIPSVLISSN